MGKQYAQLTVEERVEIYRLHADGKSRRVIAAGLGRSPATISRELRRNSLATKVWEGGYFPLRAQALTDRRRQRGALCVRSHPAFAHGFELRWPIHPPGWHPFAF